MTSKMVLGTLSSNISTPMGILSVVLVSTVVLVLIYRALLPKPIPGIPHNKISARRILGDAPDVSLNSGLILPQV